MLKKGFKQTESPEKMPVHTTGIEMVRGGGNARAERLTGGNTAADESGVSKLVSTFIKHMKGES